MSLGLHYKDGRHVFNEAGENVPFLEYPLLRETGIVRHGFSTRLGGVSRGCWASLNLSFERGDRPEAVLENFRRIGAELGVRCEDMVLSKQTHTVNVRVVTGADRGNGITREQGYTDVDGLITNEPGICLVTSYADCVPLYFVDPVKKAIGLSHSGWRGTVGKIGKMLAESKRPVLYAGSAIRYAGVRDAFLELVEKWNIPVVTAWNSIDVIWDGHPDYIGRAGMMGDRAGNFAVQNADLVISLGCRLSVRQVSYNFRTWARAAKVIMADIDRYELQKPTLHVDLPVWADLRDVVPRLAARAKDAEKGAWLSRCQKWRAKYPVITEAMCGKAKPANPYCFLKEAAKRFAEDELIVVGNGTACVAGSHGLPMRKGQRFLIQSGMASMGYDLPAALGAAFASGKKRIVLITGDGSVQMNLQELQTLLTNRVPVKIFLLNNGGYQSIRLTQKAFFGEHTLVGVGYDSGDLEFPDMRKIARAYGYPFSRCDSNEKLAGAIRRFLAKDGCGILEIMVDPAQKFEPKSSSKQLADGRIVSDSAYPHISSAGKEGR